MASDQPSQPPSPGDVLHLLQQAGRDLQSWMARIEGFNDDLTQFGQVMEAKRVGRIVSATVTEALRATEAVEQAARRQSSR